MCVSACVSACVCVCACVRACVRACMCVCCIVTTVQLPMVISFQNPDGIIVERSSNLHSPDGFLEKNFTFPSLSSVEGKWSLVASYALQVGT